jgi:hypothetical protein
MSDIDRFRPEDRRGVDTLYRRMHGADAAEAQRLRWDWQYATVPVRVSLRGLEIAGAWGTDAVVAPERERQDLGEALVRAWDRHSGAGLVLGVSTSSRELLDRLRWPVPTIVPCLVKPLTRRAVRLPHVPTPINRLISALMYPVVQVVARSRPLGAECEPIRRFDASFTTLWERLAPKFDLAVRRDAPYLNWRYIEPPCATASSR